MSHKEKELLRLKKKMLAALDIQDADFELHLMTNAQMDRLRRELMVRRDFKGAEARKIAREEMVNVLAFPEPEDFPHPEMPKRRLGEVYVNLAFGRKNTDGLARLMVHGFLHLLGYRHQGVRDTMKMEALEKKLLQGMKIGDK